MTATPPLVLKREGAVARLQLDRAEQRQTVSRAMWRAVPGLLAQAESAPAVKLVLVDSSTPACFSAGADPEELAAASGNAALARAMTEERQTALAALAGLSKPCIALVRGLCMGDGLALALACDLRFASDDARIGMTQATQGLLPSYADARALAQRVGLSRAADMMFSARLLTGAEAEQIGLVDDVWRAGAFDSAIGEYVAAIGRLSQYSVRGAKAMLRGIAAGEQHASAPSRSAFEQAFLGEDFREACVAWREGRDAVFRWR